ncbi:MAG: uroporphyrinogen-III synthase [Hellea sp.]|nr:uroporphyrinogen-III synthase [Hellea sp.]
MSERRIWISRSQPGASHSARVWQKAGFETVINPVVEIAPPKNMPRPLPKNAGLIVTSKNALRMLGTFTDHRDWPVFTVGDATAYLAWQMKFRNVISAQGNAQDLLKLIKDNFKPGGSKSFVYASAARIRLNIAGELRAAGYRARRDVYYINAPKKPDISALKGKITHIALYSPMAARVVRGTAPNFPQVKVISISANTDSELRKRFGNRRFIAARPNEKAMVAALKS